ncbi:MAG: hypothetical protein Q9197_006714 [Variospora fuerteventurae]
MTNSSPSVGNYLGMSPLLAEKDEIEQGQKITNTACGLDALERFILLSLPKAHAKFGGEHDMLVHTVGKAHGVKYLLGQAEKPFHPSHAENHKGKDLVAQEDCGCRMENWINMPFSKPKKTGDGTYAIRTAFPPDIPITPTGVAGIGPYVSSLLTTGSVFGPRPVLAVLDRHTIA